MNTNVASLTPYFRHSSLADSPAACSFSALIICSSVNLLLRMSVSRRNGLYPKSRALKGSRSYSIETRKHGSQSELHGKAGLSGQQQSVAARAAAPRDYQ